MSKLEREEKRFIDEFGEEITEKYNLLPKALFNDFNSLVKPYVNLITSFKIENKILQNQICNQLGVNPRMFSVMRKYFPELNEAMQGNSMIMKFKSRKDIVDFIEISKETGRVNARLLEIQLELFDDEYKNKKEDNGKDISIEVSFVDAEQEDIE